MQELRIGLVGTFGRATIAQSWHEDARARVVAGCDIEEDYLDLFRETYGEDTFTTNDYRELVACDDIDAVGVFTPDYIHAGPAIAAFEAGKDVFLEKPMAICIEDCDDILRAWKESGRKLFCGFNMRYMPKINTMRDIIQSGTIGEVHAVWTRHHQGRGGAAYFHDYRAVVDKARSLLLQKASHDFDVIHYVTGEYTSRVVGMGGLDVFGGDYPNDLKCDDCEIADTCPDFAGNQKKKTKGFCCYRQEVGCEDHSMVLMELENGTRSSYMQCHYTPEVSWRNYLFIGEKGSVEALQDGTIRVRTRKYNTTRHDHEFTYDEAVYRQDASPGGHGGADPLMEKDVLDFFIDGKQPRVKPLDGRMAVAVGVKGVESIRNGNQPFDIPSLPDDLQELRENHD